MVRQSLLKCAVLLVVGFTSCRTKEPDVGSARPVAARPKPLPQLERMVAGPDAGADGDSLFSVVRLPPEGPALPSGATVVVLDGERATVDGRPFVSPGPQGPLVLRPTPETYLAQVAGLLTALDDASAEVWLAHPEAPIAFRLALKDERAFQEWLDEPVAGKVRVIHRADGFEVSTNMGKLPGGDPNGPTVPLRGGQLDLEMLQRGLGRVHHRFPDAGDVCFVPSFGMELSKTAEAMAADFPRADAPIFPVTCLVYPRPVGDGGR